MSTLCHPDFQFRGNSYFKSSFPSFALRAKTFAQEMVFSEVHLTVKDTVLVGPSVCRFCFLSISEFWLSVYKKQIGVTATFNSVSR